MKIYNLIAPRLYFLAWASLMAFIVSQLFARQSWQIELFSHFVPHYALVILLSAIIFPQFKNFQAKKHGKKIRLLFALIGLTLASWCISPTAFDWINHSTFTRYTPIKIGYQNVNLDNENYRPVLDTISQHSQSDLLILLEANPDWRKQVQVFNPTYQFICGNEDRSPFAIQIFSKTANNQALVKCEMLSLADFPMAKLTLADGRTIFAVHPPPPLGSELATARLAYIRQLKTLVQAEKSAVLVIGDMNLSAFSPIYRDFITDTSLEKLTANGIPTWLPLGISIDQILTNSPHPYTSVKPLAWNGSDHRGFFVVW